MERAIVGFHRDEEEHWVAELSCGHGRHVRHDPPFWERPWVLAPETRAARLGTPLDCVRCDRGEWPDSLAFERRTPEFDADTLPAALRRRHRTKAGVWARIHLLEGRLRYRLHGAEPRETLLEAPAEAVVPPEVPHDVEPLGPVRLFIAFHRFRAPAPS